MAIELIAELATAHGGHVDLACDMVQMAADHGAHTVKIQSYTIAKLNPSDPQAEWLRQAHLDDAAHERIIAACERARVQFLSTPFDREALLLLIRLKQWRIKVPSTREPWNMSSEAFIVQLKSWAWGEKPSAHYRDIEAHLTTIPLYPAPLEAVKAAPLLDGYSDHTVGTIAAKDAISRGARIVEVHVCLPGRSRQMAWDKTPEQLREIRDWADAVETMRTGIATQFRERWNVA